MVRASCPQLKKKHRECLECTYISRYQLSEQPVGLRSPPSSYTGVCVRPFPHSVTSTKEAPALRGDATTWAHTHTLALNLRRHTHTLLLCKVTHPSLAIEEKKKAKRKVNQVNSFFVRAG